MRKIRLFGLLLSVLLMVGCAAAYVWETSDPQKKLLDAQALLNVGRPLPAENLILEAIAIYQEKDDPHGLGNAYVGFAYFLESKAVGDFEKIYRERHGGFFKDKSSTYDTRFVKAKEYRLKALECFQRAEKMYQNEGKLDRLINVYYNMAWCHYDLRDYNLGNRIKACNYFDRALEAYNENVRRDPSSKDVYTPTGVTFPEWIRFCKKDIVCP